MPEDPVAIDPESGRVDVGRVRRSQVVAAVRAIVASDGIEAVTIARIARELGTSRGVVTYHFSDKSSILHDALQSAVRDAGRAVKELLVDPDVARLTAEVGELVSRRNDWWPIYVAFLAGAKSNEFYRKELMASDETFRAELRQHLGTEARAMLVLALMKGLAVQHLVNSELSSVDITNELHALLDPWLNQSAADRQDARLPANEGKEHT